MSNLFKAILMIPSGGASKLEVREFANIFSDYNLCSSIPFEELIIQLTSLGTLSISEIKLVASPSIISYTFHHIQNKFESASPTSVYNLSTAVT